jgi:hypothetical protein
MEPDGARCDHCPVDQALPCEGLNFRRLCDLADPDHGAYNPAYRSLLERLAGAAHPTLGVVRGTGARTTLDVGESFGLLREMYDCPHRITRIECGCAGLATCVLEHGRGGLVNHHDCFACLIDRRSVPSAFPAAGAIAPGSPTCCSTEITSTE